jgi:hypothetical protein
MALLPILRLSLFCVGTDPLNSTNAMLPVPVAPLNLPPIHGANDQRCSSFAHQTGARAGSRPSFSHAAEEHQLRLVASAYWRRRIRPIAAASVGD